MNNQKQNDNKLEIFLYKMGWICGIVAILFFLVYKILERQGTLLFYPCVWYHILGFYCPGCGGTRAVSELVKGNLLKSFYYHPFVPLAAVLIFVFMVSWSVYYLSKKRIKGLKFRNWYLYAGLAIVIIQWIVKNILLFTSEFKLM